ncbi:glycosyltransferase [Cryptosporangium arvum]|uniref:glycosyltransferase n=1 Tax=Cryptosporangium arvum TaxID=80871 RepID=UPI0004AD1AFD|nr:glycosyltransferase [Cryptosporangium arvum]
MRVLLATYGTRGDVDPLVALALRLRTLGVDVRLCVPPDEEFTDRLAGLGLPSVPLGPPIRVLTSGVPPSAATLARYRAELLDAQFAGLPAAAAGCDALLAVGLAQVGARSVAEAAGIPYVYATWAAVNLPSPHHAPPPRPGWPEPEPADHRTRWARDADQVNAQFRAALNTRRAALGLAPVSDVRDHVQTDRPWLAADPALGPWRAAPGLDVVQTGAWTRPDDRPLPPAVTAFLDAGDPPVYVGFGSAGPAPGLADRAVEAVRAEGRRVLVCRGWADLDPAGCFVVGEVNHERLFARVAAVVHHGGAGTVRTAARAGTPQVAVPMPVGDNPYWAGRVAALGLGAAVDGPAATTGSLRAAVASALTAGVRARAAAVRARIRTDGAQVAAVLLRDLVSAGA